VAERRRNIVDLHCHTSASGSGVGLPPSVVSFFRRNRYRAVSITEHNNQDSLTAAREAAQDVGIEYIAGIEIAVRTDDPPPGQTTAHLLGYYVEPGQRLSTLCERTQEKGEDALEELLARLFAAGVADISEEDLREECKARCGEYDVWKRPLSSAIAGALLVRQGVLPADGTRTLKDLFAEHCPDLGDSWLPTAGEAVEALRESGGTVILAHPLGDTVPDDPDAASRCLERWLTAHVDGLEVYYPGYDGQRRRMLLDLVRRMERPYTGGSDTHEFDRADRILMSDAPYACVESMMEFRARGRALTYPEDGAGGRT